MTSPSAFDLKITADDDCENKSVCSTASEIENAAPYEVRVKIDDPRTHSLQSTKSASSSTYSLCRICQSETGNKIYPCLCAGTMGGIHETCLNQWVLYSRKQVCEICKQRYAKSGKEFLPLNQWKLPNITMRVNLIYLFHERQFLRRIFIDGLPMREPDTGRIMLTLVVLAFFAGTAFDLHRKIKNYFRKQRNVRFVDASQGKAQKECN
ncbi:RING-variant domain-containing protein [Ditylenchus destructor]|uniref:RING-variant domain-containing protein n=1 Tax=Ditylenchus destructor TaxID=166010 RepID=A0AAD4NCQ4_9BILA|nr:RING-variant domain-containing protein [Ditylenchus destructor]